MDKTLRMIVLLFVAGAAHATTFYVSTNGSDSNPGTSASPFRTIAHGIGRAVAGDTVIVEDGSYPEQFQINQSGTASAPITLMAQNKWGAVINPTGSGLVISIGGSYIQIKNFEMTDPNAQTFLKFQQGGVGGQAIGNKLHDWGLSGCVGGGSIVATQSNAVIDSNFVYNYGGGTGGTASAGCNAWDGIYIGDGNNVTVTNNLVLKGLSGGSGIQFNGEQSLIANFPSNEIFSNNTIVNEQGDGMYISCWLSGHVCDNNVVTNNIIFQTDLYFAGSGGGGWLVTHTNAGTFGTNNLYQNNLVYPSTLISMALDQTTTGTITANPLFISYTGDQTGNYHPQSSSPAIGAGVSTGCPTHDFDGNPRNGACTIGAYTSTSTVATAPAAPTGLTAIVN